MVVMIVSGGEVGYGGWDRRAEQNPRAIVKILR